MQTRVIWDKHQGILIPVTAVSRLGGETFVFVAQAPANPKPGAPTLLAQQKLVKLGAIEGDRYQVKEGLKAGDKIVVSGILNLTNGAPIIPTLVTSQAFQGTLSPRQVGQGGQGDAGTRGQGGQGGRLGRHGGQIMNDDFSKNSFIIHNS